MHGVISLPDATSHMIYTAPSWEIMTYLIFMSKMFDLMLESVLPIAQASSEVSDKPAYLCSLVKALAARTANNEQGRMYRL